MLQDQTGSCTLLQCSTDLALHSFNVVGFTSDLQKLDTLEPETSSFLSPCILVITSRLHYLQFNSTANQQIH